MVNNGVVKKIGLSVVAQRRTTVSLFEQRLSQLRLQSTQVKVSSSSLMPKQSSESNNELDYDYFLNTMTKRRKPAMLRKFAEIMTTMPSHTILFGVGIPNAETFPFKSIDVNLKDGTSYKIEGKDLKSALQYLPSKGYMPLIKKLQTFVEEIHGKQDWEKRSLLVSAGSQEAICNAFAISLNCNDPVIIPSPMYAGTVDTLRPYAPKCIPIPQDKDGVIPDVLREKLEQAKRNGDPMPKIMYVIPTACNPTGVNVSYERKKEIYQMACEYNFLILEDDPYYLLHFLEKNPESFLSMDTEGRVLRFDSFSKVMSSGLRLGFVTGPTPLLKKMELITQVSVIHTSALSQIILNNLIDEWGLDRLMESFVEVRQFYKEKRDHMVAACNKHLTGLAEWNVPNGGMFIWLRVKGIDDTYDLAMKECMEKCLLVVPGHSFYLKDNDDGNCVYIRLSFSIPSIEEMDVGCALLADVIKKATHQGKR